MKRAVFIVLAIAVAISLAACVAVPSEKQGDPTAATVQTQPVQNEAKPTEDQKPQQNANPTQTQKATEKVKAITKEEAKEIALKHAGLTADKIWDYEIEKEQEGGVVFYEIDFEASGFDYEYLIRAEDGKIIRNTKEPDRD